MEYVEIPYKRNERGKIVKPDPWYLIEEVKKRTKHWTPEDKLKAYKMIRDGVKLEFILWIE